MGTQRKKVEKKKLPAVKERKANTPIVERERTQTKNPEPSMLMTETSRANRENNQRDVDTIQRKKVEKGKFPTIKEIKERKANTPIVERERRKFENPEIETIRKKEVEKKKLLIIKEKKANKPMVKQERRQIVNS